MKFESSLQIVRPDLLEKIDRLFACNVGEYVDLPQIVVVGDQSSGKSSVLEALTDLPFPRDSSLCTRFATQITFRRSTQSSIVASIIPSKSAGPDHQDRLRAWRRPNIDSLEPASFSTLMQEVMNEMGVGSASDQNRSTFSQDVFRLEISGPNQEHFSVIDVPGIFKRTTQGVTTKDDMKMVDEMVRGYMSNPRSIMLTVVPCNVDIATQEILQRAEDIDPEGMRTFGVLTKPDLVDKGTEMAIIDLVEGRKHELQLGWHLLRNPGQSDLNNVTRTRHSIESEFFRNTSPWNELDTEKVGIGSLRIRLQAILGDHIQREFPKVTQEPNTRCCSLANTKKVKSEILTRLKASEKKLGDLGPKRQTEAEQRNFIMSLSLKFQQTVNFALNSNYSRANIFDEKPKLRIATMVVNRGEAFAATMATYGHAFHFDSGENENTLETEGLEESFTSDLSLVDEATINVRTENDIPNLEDIIHESKSVTVPQKNISQWLKQLYHGSRGFELGTFDASLLAVTMKAQGKKWSDLSLGYISDTIIVVHGFVQNVVHHVVPNNRVYDGIMSLLMGPVLERYQGAMKKTRFLLEVELSGMPATHNHYFNDSLEKCRQQRLQSSLASKSFSGCEHGTVVRLEDITQNHPLSNSDHVIQEIHDILRSYYKLARKRFVDCVRMQVADYFLTLGPDTPLTIFSPQFVGDLTPEQLEEVAGEDLVTKRKRAQLEKEINQLEQGRKILG